MKRTLNPFRLGLFVLVGIVLTLGALIWAGIADFMTRENTYVTFFDRAVEGLQVGAPVSFRGVRIGQVASIGIAPDHRLIRVSAKIRKDFKVGENMVFRLAKRGITGQSYLLLDFLEPDEKVEIPTLSFSVKYPILPNRPGELELIMETAQKVLAKVQDLDLQDLAGEWRETARGLAEAIDPEEIDRTLANLRSASEDLRTILQGLSPTGRSEDWRNVYRDIASAAEALRQSGERLSAQLEAVSPETLERTAKGMEELVQNGQASVQSWDRQVDRSLALLENNMREVNRLIDELSRLVDSLRREPGQLLEQRRGGEPFRR